MNNLFDTPTAIKLSQYNARIKHAVAYAPDLQGQWVLAETSDVAVRRGHCYLELVEKDPNSGMTVARVGAVIWANTFASLSARFQSVTGNSFGTGMKVMVRVNANFHEQYGLKLIITDFNPEFTLGDMERQRREILNRLANEGLIERNRRRYQDNFARSNAAIQKLSGSIQNSVLLHLQHHARQKEQEDEEEA